MADETVILNGNAAPFVEDESGAASGETDITPGHFVTLDSSREVNLQSGEATDGRGIIAVQSRSDPSLTKSDKYNSDDDGERVSLAYVPIGGKVDAFVVAGADLTTVGNANISEGDLLVETDNGGLANAHSETRGSDDNVLYRAEEAVDNSGASAGVDNQSRIEARRVA